MSGYLSMGFGFVWAFRSDGASVQILIDVIVIYHVYVPSHLFFELRTKVSYEDIFFYFCGTAARGTLQDVKRERPKSRFAAV